ncbi:MAG: D-TA family PLP-dependent enzyme [Chloroflexota bacterium]
MSLTVGDLDTPAVTIDLDRMERNIARLQSYCDTHGLRNRPHIKTHKIPAIAHLQMAAGAIGITCQKVGEAEVMAAAGLRDILITYNILGQPKLERLMRLTRQATVAVVADSEMTVRGLSDAAKAEGCTLTVLVECDMGAERVGVQSPEAALELATVVDGAPGLLFGGLMTYPILPATSGWLARAHDIFGAAGLPLTWISGGGTPNMFTSHETPGVTEIRAGTYVYMDGTCVRQGVATWDDCAQRVIMTVVSRPTPERAILDGGSKTLTSDLILGRLEEGYGHIVEYPEATIYKQSEEHGHVDLTNCAHKPRVGERVTVISNHCCATTNLHDEVVGVRGNRIEVVWPVTARGKIR